jgi:AcrR family transcriptional regulator
LYGGDVARTLDPVAYGTRRDAFLDVAQRLMQTKGYERMSVQDVLAGVETSKGSFYHYFDSKGALLDGVIERMVAQAIAAVEPVVADPGLDAVAKVHGLFDGIASYKTAHKDLLLAVLEVWLSDENAIVREKFRRSAASGLTPLLARIVRQGCADGTFTASSPDDAAGVLVTFLLGLNQAVTELYLARNAGRISFEEVERAFAAYAEAFDRILGAPPGSLHLVDEPVLHEWFD